MNFIRFLETAMNAPDSIFTPAAGNAPDAARFAQLLAQMELRGGTLHLSGLKLPVEQVLRQAGLLDLRPGLAMYRTDAEALVALQQLPEPVARA